MKRMLFYLILFLIVPVASCDHKRGSNSGEAEKNRVGFENNANAFVTGLSVEPLLGKADSAQVIFYDDPQGAPERYARYFTYAATRDSSLLGVVSRIFSGQPDIRQNTKDCRSEGKIYLFSGNEPVKTVFFSSQPDQCRYLYFIKDGLFYYAGIDTSFSAILKKMKANAVKP